MHFTIHLDNGFRSQVLNDPFPQTNERTMTAMSSVLKIAEVFPPEEEKSEFQLKTEENCKLQTAQGMLHCYMKPGGRSWLEKVPVAEETTKKTALRMLLLRDRRLALSPAR